MQNCNAEHLQYLTLMFNCDGVPVFRSSGCSIWPILCTVNELPPKLRRKNVLLVALWFESGKPDMDIFFQPFVNEMIKLRDVGFTWMHNKKRVNTKVMVLVGVCDAVARPLLQNLKQFNGKLGCGFCLDAGVRTAQGRGSTRAYPYKTDSMLRTDASTRELGQRAFETGSENLGVKGPTILSLLPDFNIIDGIVPDYMHSVLLGVTRQLAGLWFGTKNNHEWFYLGGKVKEIDADLQCIKPPCNISRSPRSLGIRKFWKAHVGCFITVL